MADTGPPTDQRGGPRSVAAVVAVISILAIGVATVAVVGGVRWSKANQAPPWAEMTAALRSLPLDAGMRAGPIRRSGGAWGLNPTCEIPRVLVTVDVTDDLPLTCARLLHLADEWEDQGFVPALDGTRRTGADCGIDGHLRGLGAGILRLDDRSFVVSVARN